MRSKISFFNKGLFFSNIKRFSWACILETVVMFFFYPFSLMMMHPDAAWLENVTDILERRQEYTALCNLSICVYAVALAVLLFHYLHQPKMTTALHGLPVSRTELFFSAVLTAYSSPPQQGTVMRVIVMLRISFWVKICVSFSL